MNELISVIVPIYNVAPYLEECCEQLQIKHIKILKLF